MGGSAFRKMVSGVLLLLFPGSLLAADSNAAMLYTNGPAWVNGTHVPRASFTIFSGDLLQTRSDSVANINQPGSTITVLSDSMVKFKGSSVDLQHGGVSIATSKGTAMTAGIVKVAPAQFSWTEFNVVDVDGTVRIAARKGDLTITDGKEVFTLAQGQQTTRDESAQEQTTDQGTTTTKKRKNQSGAAAPGATGGALNSPWAVGAAGAAVVGVTAWVLVHNDNPASPVKP